MNRFYSMTRAWAIALIWIHSMSALTKGQDIVTGGLKISKESADLIIDFETGGRSYYEAKLKRVTVPPGQSGVTGGSGFDFGYNTPAQIREAWSGVLPDAQVERLVRVSGKTGASARAALPSVKDITITWDQAMQVYSKTSMPRFAKLTLQTYPKIENLHPHIQGVMLSTTFNRGSAMTPYSRRKELVWSRDSIREGNIKVLPGFQKSMVRLWPNIRGLQRRYTAHAALMQRAVDGR
jgi:hypothetical protein